MSKKQQPSQNSSNQRISSIGDSSQARITVELTDAEPGRVSGGPSSPAAS